MTRTQKILLALISAIALAPASLFAQSAPGAPGAVPTWTSVAKRAWERRPPSNRKFGLRCKAER